MKWRNIVDRPAWITITTGPEFDAGLRGPVPATGMFESLDAMTGEPIEGFAVR